MSASCDVCHRSVEDGAWMVVYDTTSPRPVYDPSLRGTGPTNADQLITYRVCGKCYGKDVMVLEPCPTCAYVARRKHRLYVTYTQGIRSYQPMAGLKPRECRACRLERRAQELNRDAQAFREQAFAIRSKRIREAMARANPGGNRA